MTCIWYTSEDKGYIVHHNATHIQLPTASKSRRRSLPLLRATLVQQLPVYDTMTVPVFGPCPGYDDASSTYGGASGFCRFKLGGLAFTLRHHICMTVLVHAVKAGVRGAYKRRLQRAPCFLQDPRVASSRSVASLAEAGSPISSLDDVLVVLHGLDEKSGMRFGRVGFDAVTEVHNVVLAT